MRNFLGALAAFVLWTGAAQAQAQGISCSHTEQDGCLEFDVLLMPADPHVPEIQELLAIDTPGQRDSAKVLDGKLGHRMYQGMKEGRVPGYTSCVPVVFRFFGANLQVLVDRMVEYRMSQHAGPADVPVPSRLRGSFRTSSVKAYDPQTGASYGEGVEYTLEVCGAKGALQVPWEFLPAGAAVQIEPQMATVFPRRTKGEDPKALWLTVSRMNAMRSDDGRSRFEYVFIPIITPEAKPRGAPIR